MTRRILFRKCDVSKWNDVLDLFEAGVKTFGVIHAVLCNAGINSADFEDHVVDPRTGRLQPPSMKVLDVDLYGVVFTVKCALWYFGKWPQTRCQIVITGSVASFVDGPNMHLYMAAKTGVLGLMRGLRTKVVDKNMTINLVAPWATGRIVQFFDRHIRAHPSHAETPMLRKEMNPADMPLNQPSHIARALLLPVLRPEINGKSFWVSGGDIAELEDTIHQSQPAWLGKKMSDDLDEGQRKTVPNWERVVLSYKRPDSRALRSKI